MAKTFFDQVYGATADIKKAMKKPIIQKKVTRALDGAADSYESQKIDAQVELDSLYDRLVNGDTDAIQAIVEKELEIEELDTQARAVAAIKAKLAAPAKEEK